MVSVVCFGMQGYRGNQSRPLDKILAPDSLSVSSVPSHVQLVLLVAVRTHVSQDSHESSSRHRIWDHTVLVSRFIFSSQLLPQSTRELLRKLYM